MICTFLSDLGFNDPYVAIVKGLFYKHLPMAQMIDISHQVQAQDITHAAFLVQASFPFFAEETVHLILTDIFYQDPPVLVFANYQNHWFIAPDNGIIPLITNGQVELGRGVVCQKSFFEEAVQIATALLSNTKIESESIVLNKKIWSLPINGPDFIRGIFFHIDTFGNCISNISYSLFESIRQNRSFEVVVRNLRIKNIANSYASVPEGEAMAFFGISGFLELGIRKGSAASLLGLSSWDMISVLFFDQPS